MKPSFAVGLAILPALAGAEPALTHTDVFTSGQDGYAMYRIPAIETAPDGSLLAFAEARRYNGGDPGMENNEIDLVLKRSADGGRSWSSMQVIEHAGDRWSAANPATVVDSKAKRVWVIYLRCRPGRHTDSSRPGTDDMQTRARYSADSGTTWSEPVDLTAAARDMNDPRWRSSVVGPGGAIRTRRGRLLAAGWKAVPYVPFALYSDDHGKTWRRGEPVPGVEGGNECQVAELADGRILMDIRQNDGPRRWRAYSGDGGQTWSMPQPGEEVTPVACAIERFPPGPGRSALVWTGPKGPGRRTLVARVSHDEGRTFSGERLIAEEPAAYSDMAILKDKSIGVLWERGDYRHITFTRLPRAFLDPR
ncbi:MAG: exo-alpha-sialidase [Armatimonadetes bacterium]|nr:exo-alpha-sialidase [Armatimonadota bacterium]